jgi:hypothetical protein
MYPMMKSSEVHKLTVFCHVGREVEVRFFALIPCSAITAGTTSRVLQFGHSLLATRSEAATEPWLKYHAHNTSSVLFAIDWSGMSTFDLPVIARQVFYTFLWYQTCTCMI